MYLGQYWASLVAQLLKTQLATQETRFVSRAGRFPGEGIGFPLEYSWVSLVAQMVKNPPAMQRPGFDPWVQRNPGGGHGNPLQYSCLENPHGQGSLQGYGPWGRRESDTTKRKLKREHKGNIMFNGSLGNQNFYCIE